MRVKVFTRSEESINQNTKDKKIKKDWYLDNTIPISESVTVTNNQRNYFYDLRP